MKESVRATEELVKVIEKWPAEKHDAILELVAQRTEEFRDYYRQLGPIEFVKAFYEVFDEGLAANIKGVSCKRKCHFCCRQNVTIWSHEAAVIGEFCKANNIAIPKDYLLEQLKFGWKEVAKEEVGWCTFLKDGECSIYKARLLACRNYHVASPPELCDTFKYPSDKGHRVAVAVFTMPEVEASAFFGLMHDKGKFGRLPEMLLPYSK